MKTQNKTTVNTWLPVFSGFYGTIWETDRDEEMEIENINEQRREKKLPPISWDEIEWDYEGYRQNVAKGFTRWIGAELKDLGMIDGVQFQKLRSPREYNFANESIDVSFTLSGANRAAIQDYLAKHTTAFKEYIAERYTSYDGFFSFHPHNAAEWTADLSDTLEDEHKLGAVFHFILLNEDPEMEMSIYEDLSGNGCTLQAKNYSALVEGLAI